MSSSDDDILAVARDGYLEEARENLHQFEQALLAMETDPGNTEAVNTAFRAAHTIKGGAGMFGYDAVVHFTHDVESLLDDIREGTAALGDGAMGVLLKSLDQMGKLLAEVGRGNPDPVVAAASAALGLELRALRGTAAAKPDAASAANGAAAPNEGHEGVWHLSLQMGADALRNGLDPASFIRYLTTLGTVQGIRTLSHRLPDLTALDPETCYLGFEIRLQSSADRATIEGVFEFLREDCDLVVLEPDSPSAAYETLLKQRATSDAARSEILECWQQLAGPNAAPFIERRAQSTDRRTTEPERRAGKDRRAGDETRFIRVRADKLDKLVDLIGELVIASSGAQLVASREQSATFGEAALRIHDLVQEARDGALGLRMVPIGETFTRFQRVVRDVCKQLGKDVELEISGGDTELDKSMVETIADPLMHLVRNSLDHGIEPSDERIAAGKSAQGHLALHAYHESGAVVIEVSDDGRGLNRERILAKAIERELVAPNQELSDDEIYQLIFRPGFSTAEQVTNLSGRGVGMDVVKRNVEALRGQIKVASTPGKGATIQIRLPLTLAIIDGFLTAVGNASYVLPLDIVAECIAVPKECRAHPGQVSGTFDLRGEVLPYLDLSLFYGQVPIESGRRSLVLVRDGSLRFGLVVDRLLGEHQTVIKPLSPIFRHLKAISGSTILGSGEVAMVIDVPGLMACAIQSTNSLRPSAQRFH
jgi:two-component system chemotaxis sensor kinase CheA